MSKYDIQHTTSSPYYPQANGLAECAVHIAKSIMKQPDPQLALLSYRDTATEPTKESPARLLMGRRLRTTVSKLNHLLRPAWPDLSIVKQKELMKEPTSGDIQLSRFLLWMWGTGCLSKLTLRRNGARPGSSRLQVQHYGRLLWKCPEVKPSNETAWNLQTVNKELNETQPGTTSTSPDSSVITQDVPGSTGFESETATGTRTPRAKGTHSGRVVKPVLKLTF